MMTTTLDSEWLRDTIRSSLVSGSMTSSDDEFGPPEQRDPRFRKLIEGVFFSRRLILTYNVIICCLLLVMAAVHWSQRVYKWRRRPKLGLELVKDDVIYDKDAVFKDLRNGKGTPEDPESSGSSTSEGTMSPPRQVKDINEETPLLHIGQTSQVLPQRSSIIAYLKAFLIYQPQPIPLVNKTLPSNGYTVAIMAFILLNIFYTIFRIDFTIFELFVFADRAGLVFVANLPLLYLLAAKMEPIKLLTGYSYESLNIIHRRLGELLCLEALLHALGMMTVWYTILRPRESLTDFLLQKMILLGLGALIAYELLYFTSLASFRRRWYELFLGLHIFLQAAALALVFFHHKGARIYVGIALGIFLVDRLVYRIWARSTTVTSVVEVMGDQETVRISATLNLAHGSALGSMLGGNITSGWQASDHVFLTIPDLGHGHIFQAHPFTIISPAPITSQKVAKLELLIRAQTGFSSDLLTEAIRRTSLNIRLDGPYGGHHSRALLQDSDLSLVVAGGSGIAVAWPLVNFLLQEPSSPYSDMENASIASRPRQAIVLIWVIHRTAHLSWIGWPALRALEGQGVQVIVPDATEEVGRPDLESMIRGFVANTGYGKRIGVVGSGPDSMGRSVRNTCARMVREGWDVGVTIEKFGW